MKALRVVCILALLGMLALSVPAAADEGPGVAEAPVGDAIHFLPIVGDLTTGLEVMNVGGWATYVDVWYYDSTGLRIALQQNIRINSLSSRTIYPLPAAVTAASSAVVVSYMDPFAPGAPAVVKNSPAYATDDLTFGTTGYIWGEPIAVTVNRMAAGGAPAATYTGIGRPLLPWDEADGLPYAGQDTYWIYAPVIQKNNNGWNSTIWIQNAFLADMFGLAITPLPDVDVDIYFYTADGANLVAQANLYIPAFASVQLPVPLTLATGAYSAWIRANALVAAVADQYDGASPAAANIFMSYRASAKNRFDGGRSTADFNFGPLIFSQYNGWESGLAVLNTSETQDADVVATFRAKDGTVLHTLNTTLEERSDWIIYPLSSFGLPVDQVGSVSVEAQWYWPPGAPAPVNPDNAIVAVVNQFNQTESKGSAYNAFRANFDVADGDWVGLDTASRLAAPLMMKYNGGGASQNTGWSTGIVVMNTDLDDYDAERIDLSFWDAAGGPVPINRVRLNLRGGTTHVIDMRYSTRNTIPAGWVGACTVSSQFGADWRP